MNAIAPDWTRTPGNNPPHHELARRRYVPLGREGVVEECGDVVAFLCSPMARYVTGAVIPVDGGTAAAAGWLRTPGGGWSLLGRDG